MSPIYEEHRSTRYEPPAIDLENKNSSQVLLIELTGRNKDVLEVGTSTGYISRILKERGNTVTGIEIDPEAAEIAREHCNSMIIGDIEKLDLDAYLTPSSFDVIVFGDVLEHLVSPEDVLRKVKKYLRPDGYLAVSLPNVCHGDVILNLLMGDFKYTSMGLLDATHLRFFGLRNIIDLFSRCGYFVTDLQTTVHPVGATEQRLDPGVVPEDLANFVKSLPNSSVYQYIFKASPSPTPEAVEAVPAPDLDDLFRGAIEGSIQAEIKPLLEELSAYEVRTVSLAEQVEQQAIQVMQLSNELASMKQSVVWRLLMKFHNGFVERVLPPSTRRREIYDLGLKGGRILFDEGLRCLWLKAREYYKFRKNAVSRSLCCAGSNDIEPSHKFCKAMKNDDVVDSLVLKYIRGRGICIGTENTSPRVPRNVNIIHINVDYAKALLESDLGRSRTSCLSGTTYTGYEPKLSCLDFCMVFNIVEKMDEPQIFLEHCLNSLKVGGILYLATDDRSSPIIRGFLSSNTDAGRNPPDRTEFALDSCYLNDYINIVEIAENQKIPQGEAEHVYIIEKTGYLGQIEDLLKTSDALVIQDEFDIDVIIPVYNAYEDLIRCTYSVFKHWDNFRVILINDCSTDARISDLFSKLQAFKSDKLVLLENEENLGFVKTVNRGMKYSKNDVILLNSDTIVTSGWAKKLHRCAYSNKDIATVTPFTNNGTICSVPSFCEENDIPAGFTVDSFAEFIEKISFREYPEIPTAVGFCMYIKREALERIGYFDGESFGKGYGEENDFCMRAKDYGYKHVLCDDTFVFHKGEGSFSARKAELCRKNLEVLSQKHPEYLPIVHEYIQSNPLVELHENIRQRMRTWDPNGRKKKILFLLHTWGGGTEKHVRDLINALQDYIFYVLQVEGTRVVLTEVNNGHETEYVFTMESPLKQFEFHNDEYEKILLDIIDTFKISLIHIHHLIGHSFDISTVAKRRGIPLLYTVHDYYSVCPNINLLDCNLKLCFGDRSIAKCDACLNKSKGLSPGFITKWRSHFSDIFESCEAIICPSRSVPEILSMYYPSVRDKTIVIEHGIDERGADRAGTNGGSFETSQNDLFHIAYIGGLGPNKGRDLFYKLACSKEFEGRIIWSILGTSDLHSKPGYYASHNIHVYGHYKDFDELRMLVTKKKVDLIILPAICPETYSYTLSEAWALGIPVVVSGLGALKERVEKHGGGWVVNGSDLDDFKAKIIEILDSPEDYSEKKRETMGIVLKSVAEMAGEYWCLYTHHIEMTQGRALLKPSSRGSAPSEGKDL